MARRVPCRGVGRGFFSARVSVTADVWFLLQGRRPGSAIPGYTPRQCSSEQRPDGSLEFLENATRARYSKRKSQKKRKPRGNRRGWDSKGRARSPWNWLKCLEKGPFVFNRLHGLTRQRVARRAAALASDSLHCRRQRRAANNAMAAMAPHHTGHEGSASSRVVNEFTRGRRQFLHINIFFLFYLLGGVYCDTVVGMKFARYRLRAAMG